MLISPGGKSGVALVVLGVLVLSAITAGWMLSVRSLDDHECFVSVTAREMLASGNWVMPTFNGRPRLQKTPLSYWFVAGVAKVTGKATAERGFRVFVRLRGAVFCESLAVASGRAYSHGRMGDIDWVR